MIAGRERERQIVVDQVLRREAVFIDDDIVDLLRDLELALARLRHADRIDRQRDERSAVFLRERHDAIDALAAVLHVDGVDDRAARNRLERAFDHGRLCRVDHDRRLDGHRDEFDDPRHLLGFVSAFCDGDADVEHVCAALDLFARDVADGFVVVGEEESLHFARSLGVDAFTDEQGLRVLLEVGGAHGAGSSRDPRAVNTSRQGQGSRVGDRGLRSALDP